RLLGRRRWPWYSEWRPALRRATDTVRKSIEETGLPEHFGNCLVRCLKIKRKFVLCTRDSTERISGPRNGGWPIFETEKSLMKSFGWNTRSIVLAIPALGWDH